MKAESVLLCWVKERDMKFFYQIRDPLQVPISGFCLNQLLILKRGGIRRIVFMKRIL